MVEHSPPAHGETFVGAGFDTWAGSPFVQARLALLGKTVFLLSFGFFAVINCVVIVGGGFELLPSLVTQANVMHFLSSSMMGALWAIASLRPWSLRALGVLDGGSLLFAGVGLGLMAAQPDEKQLMAGLFALAVTMMARASDSSDRAMDSRARRALVGRKRAADVIYATGRRRPALAGSPPTSGHPPGAHVVELSDRAERIGGEAQESLGSVEEAFDRRDQQRWGFLHGVVATVGDRLHAQVLAQRR